MWRALARATHPEATAAVTAITTVLALAAGRGVGAVWVAAAVLAGQASVGWSNDWLDAGRDLAAGRADKPVATGAVSASRLRRAAVGALIACAALSLASGLLAALAHLVAVGLAWLYNLDLKSRVTSVLPYAGAFGLLPAFVTLGLPGAALPPWWAMAGAALLGAGAHFTQVLPDLAADEVTGVRGLPQRLGAAGSVASAAVLLGSGLLVIVLGPAGPPGGFGLWLLGAGLGLVAAVAVTGLGGRHRLAFPLTLGAAATAVAALLASGNRLA